MLDNELAVQLSRRPFDDFHRFSAVLDANPKAPRKARRELWDLVSAPLSPEEMQIPLNKSGEGLDKERLKRMQEAVGHIRLPHDLVRDPFQGGCPWHGDCLEGLASGPAIEKRWQTKAENLKPDHPAWELEAQYLGAACADFLCTLSPQKIVMGGGVMDVPGLIEKVRTATTLQLADYLRHPEIQAGLGTVIVQPGLGSRAGLCGALALAMSVSG